MPWQQESSFTLLLGPPCDKIKNAGVSSSRAILPAQGLNPGSMLRGDQVIPYMLAIDTSPLRQPGSAASNAAKKPKAPSNGI